MARKKVNIRDVAAACGYSIYTISLVLNGKSGVSEAARAKIQQTIEQLGYDPLKNMPLANKLSAKTLGLVMPAIDCEGHRFYFRAISQARSFASSHGWDIKLFTESDLQTRINENVHQSRSMGFDSLIVFCCVPPVDCIKRLRGQGIPVALIRRDMDVKGILKIHDDDFQGITLAMEHLHGFHGHSRIAILSPEFDSPAAQLRKQAFLQYAGEHDLPLGEDMLLASHTFGSDIYEILWAKFRADQISACICIDDDTAAAAAKYMLNRGIKIPEQFALIGYNNDRIAGMFHPGISSVNVPVEQMIDAACGAILHQKPTAQMASTEICFENSLVVRQSCGCNWPRAQA